MTSGSFLAISAMIIAVSSKEVWFPPNFPPALDFFDMGNLQRTKNKIALFVLSVKLRWLDPLRSEASDVRTQHQNKVRILGKACLVGEFV